MIDPVINAESIQPGLMILHSNRLESLRDLLVHWLRAYPLGALEDEVVLVQSNGMAQWLKAALAADSDAEPAGLGVCAAVSMQFPARFFWQAYRAVLAADAIPKSSPYDKGALRWRILRLLPSLLDETDFEPLQHYLNDDSDGRKAWQLAQQLADLFDQYQVYRADWLADWSQSIDVLRLAPERNAPALPLPARELWQARLWRAIESEISAESALTGANIEHRGYLQSRFMTTLRAANVRPAGLPRRVIVWGFSTLPGHIIEGLAALGQHVQIILAVVNPCRHYWADLLQPRPHSRHAPKVSLMGQMSAHELSQYANPLLLAWGQQGRDYLRRLEAFDDPELYRARFQAQGQRIDLFDDDACAHTLLAQVQYAIFDLQAVPSEPALRLPIVATDTSLRFQVAHSRLREVEALHDYLLASFEASKQQGSALRPQDVVVMVPDIRDYAPLIEAVFACNDERRLPFTILDRPQRGHEPLLASLDWLLTLPTARCTSAEIWDLLDVPAIRARFGLSAEDLPRLRYWFEAAGARWGLDAEHRQQWQMPVELKQNTWRFALDRLLLGYAVGDALDNDQLFSGVLPFVDLSPLEATRIGYMTHLLDSLGHWARALNVTQSANAWGETLRQLLSAFFNADDDQERLLLEQVQQSLAAWLAEAADSTQDLSLAVVRDSWLASLDEVSMSQRFLSGAIHVATLMPMRAIPFRLVCILGLNDGEFPRQRPPQDFDLMSLKKVARAGDRSRRDDDRYLFLEAILSAREQVLLSWVGRSARTNQVKPPSLLVAQLQDYLRVGWSYNDADPVSMLTTEHALQPFSPRYFSAVPGTSGEAVLTVGSSYARPWRDAHEIRPPCVYQALPPQSPVLTLSLTQLRQWLRDPARVFYRERLGVAFADGVTAIAEQEPFLVSGIAQYEASDALLQAIHREHGEAAVRRVVNERSGRGEWPLAGFAEPAKVHLTQLAETLWLSTEAWRLAEALPALLVSWQGTVKARVIDAELVAEAVEVTLETVVHSIRRSPDGVCWHWFFTASKLHDSKCRLQKWHPLLEPWLTHVLLALNAQSMPTRVLSPTGIVEWPALSLEAAERWWHALLGYYLCGLNQALAFEAKTAFAFAAVWKPVEALTSAAALCTHMPDDLLEAALQAAAKQYEGSDFMATFSAADEAPLGWLWPDFAALSASGQFVDISQHVFLPIVVATLSQRTTGIAS